MTTEEQNPENTNGMTPAEIIQQHIQHPEQRITGKEIREAKTTEAPTDTIPENKADTDQEIKQEKKEKDERQFPITTPYDVLGS